MYRVRIKSHFSSAHNLREYQGACERLHGHNWKVEAYLKSETLDKLGMVEDFKMFKKHLNVIMNELDHEYINELEYFKTVNPTSENMTKYIFDELAAAYGEKVDKVIVWETDTSAAEYSKD